MRLLQFIALTVVLSACSNADYIVDSDNLNVDSTYYSDDLELLIAPYRELVDAQMNDLIGRCDSTLVKYEPESPLGNFAADALFKKGITLNPPNFPDMSSKNTIALLNFGGLRAPINKGDITVGNVYELMPFDNTITIVKIKGEAVRDLTTYLFEMNGQPVSNAKFELSNDFRKMDLSDEFNFATSDLYIITSNYLAGGGDNMDFLENANEKWDAGILLRDVFIDYIRETNLITNPGIDGRMKIEKE